MFSADQTESRAAEVCRELCPLKGQDQQHHRALDVCSGFSEISCMTKEESSSLCLISKVGVSLMMGNGKVLKLGEERQILLFGAMIYGHRSQLEATLWLLLSLL